MSVQSGNRPQRVSAVIAGQLLEAGGVRPSIDLHVYRGDVQGVLQFHHILRDLLKTHEFGQADNFWHHALPGIQDLGRLIVGEKGLLCAQLEAVHAGLRPGQGNREGIFFLSRRVGKNHFFRGERRNVYVFPRAERLPVARSRYIDPAACAAQIAHAHPHFVLRIKDEGILRPNMFREDGEVRQLTHVLQFSRAAYIPQLKISLRRYCDIHVSFHQIVPRIGGIIAHQCVLRAILQCVDDGLPFQFRKSRL